MKLFKTYCLGLHYSQLYKSLILKYHKDKPDKHKPNRAWTDKKWNIYNG
jgi:hypothetical protein